MALIAMPSFQTDTTYVNLKMHNKKNEPVPPMRRIWPENDANDELSNEDNVYASLIKKNSENLDNGDDAAGVKGLDD
jgi:hypothetical protein